MFDLVDVHLEFFRDVTADRFPLLAAHHAQFAQQPRIKDYLESDNRHKLIFGHQWEQQRQQQQRPAPERWTGVSAPMGAFDPLASRQKESRGAEAERSTAVCAPMEAFDPFALKQKERKGPETARQKESRGAEAERRTSAPMKAFDPLPSKQKEGRDMQAAKQLEGRDEEAARQKESRGKEEHKPDKDYIYMEQSLNL